MDTGNGEANLIERFRAGDEAAFEALFARHQSLVSGRIRRWLPAAVLRKVSVADVLQETRIVAFERRESFEYRGPASFRNWLLGIADMKARRMLKHFAGSAKRDVCREVSRLQRDETAHHPGAEPTPSQHAIAAELCDIVRAAMDTLRPDYREVLELTREQHLSLEEAAQRMGRSFEATRKLRARALFRFTEVFERMRGESDG